MQSDKLPQRTPKSQTGLMFVDNDGILADSKPEVQRECRKHQIESYRRFLANKERRPDGRPVSYDSNNRRVVHSVGTGGGTLPTTEP